MAPAHQGSREPNALAELNADAAVAAAALAAAAAASASDEQHTPASPRADDHSVSAIPDVCAGADAGASAPVPKPKEDRMHDDGSGDDGSTPGTQSVPSVAPTMTAQELQKLAVEAARQQQEQQQRQQSASSEQQIQRAQAQGSDAADESRYQDLLSGWAANAQDVDENQQAYGANGADADASMDVSHLADISTTSTVAGVGVAATGPGTKGKRAANTDETDTEGSARKHPRHNNSHSSGGYRPGERNKRITRSRKVNSCLQCRAKKQKCDRQHPVCGNCQLQQAGKNGAVKGQHIACTYLDGPLQAPVSGHGVAGADVLLNSTFANVTALPSSNLLAASSSSSSGVPISTGAKVVPPGLRDLVRQAYTISRTPAHEFPMRVKAARAAVVGWTLASHHLSLPSPKRAVELMEVYDRHIAWYCTIVLPDLVTPRLEHFLKWFHEAPTALPADPPFVPLALSLIALALQAIRTTGDPLSRQHLVIDPDQQNTSGSMADIVVEPSCSTERQLLELAGRCIDGLQLACPSAWASAYQAPIDLVKASVLRALWHLNEQHISFAGTCFGVAVRLSYAAGLHRDPKHWSSISREEAQARRNLWWNVVYFEITQSVRNNTPSSVTPGSFDTELPNDYEAIRNIYNNAIRHQQQAALLSGVPIDRPYQHPSLNRAKGLTGFFSLVRVQLQQEAQMQRANRMPSHSLVKTMGVAWDSFRADLPAGIRDAFDADTQRREANARSGLPATGIITPETRIDNANDRIDWLQRGVMQLCFWHGQMTIHRPYADDEWKREARGNLEKCLVSAQCITWLVSEILRRDPPFLLISLCSYHVFAAGVILGIFIRVDPRNDTVEHLRRTLDKAITCLDSIAHRSKFGNVAEQADRYATALKEMVAQDADKRKPPVVPPFEVRPEPAGALTQPQQEQHQQLTSSGPDSVPPPGPAPDAQNIACQNSATASEIDTANLELLGNLADASGAVVGVRNVDASANAGNDGGDKTDGERAANHLANWMRELDGSFKERPFPGTNYNYAPGPTAAASGVIDPSLEGGSGGVSAPSQSNQHQHGQPQTWHGQGQQRSSSDQQAFSPTSSDMSSVGDFAQNWTGWERFVDSVLLQKDVGNGDFLSLLS